MTLHELLKAAEAAERSERIARGLPPDHLTDLSHFPFAFALDDVARFKAAAERVPDYAAAVALANKDYARAGFGGAIKNPAPAPPVEGEYPIEPAFFFSCDGSYFKDLCLPLLMSISEHSPGLRCHVHLVDAPEGIEGLSAVIKLNLSFTRESSGFADADQQTRRAYYHAIRFVRFAEALERNPGPLWIADVDAVVTRDVRPLLSEKAPLAMRMRAGRLNLSSQASACLVLGTARSLDFFRYVSRFLRGNPLFWGIDQFALFSAFVALKPEIALIGPDLAGVEVDQPGAFWFTAGKQKRTLITDETPYALEYRRVARAYLKLLADSKRSQVAARS